MGRSIHSELSVATVPLLLVCAACTSDLTVPQEAQLGCASAADCPSGWACNEKVGRCVKTENIDSDAPALVGEATVLPPVLKKGAAATVSFEVSEELSKDPELTVKIAGVDRPLTRDAASSGVKYAYTYTAAGDEPQVESAITIVLTDKSGNKSGNLSGKALRFDFSAPEVGDAVIERSPVKKEAMAAVKFSVSEALKSDPVVKLTTGEALTKDETSKAAKYVYTYVASGNEDESIAGVGVMVSIEDEARNQASVALEKSIVFDFVSPALSEAPTLNPSVAKSGDLVSVTFATNEPVKVPAVAIEGAPMDLSGSSSSLETAFKFTYVATGGTDTEGEKAIVIALEDAAGNKAEGLPGGAVTFDFTPPALSEPKVEPSRAKAGAPVTVTFTVDEPLNTDPVVKAGSIEFTRTGYQLSAISYQLSPAPVAYTYSYTLTGYEEQTGLTVTVDLTDEAGNTATGLVAGSFVPDFVAPSILGTPAINKAFAKAGDEVTLAFSVSEAQKADPVVAAGALAFSKKSRNANDYVFAYTLAGNETQGLKNVSIDLLDAAENAASAIPGGGFAVDFSAPGLSTEPVVTPSVAKAGDLVSVTFESSEGLLGDPVVTLGSIAMSKGASSGRTYTYTHVADAADGEGEHGLTITLKDLAGNESGPITRPGARFDFTAPGLANVSVTPSKAKAGVTVTASFSVDGELQSDPVVKAGALSFAKDPGSSGGDYVYTYTLVGTEPQSGLTVTADVVDAGGNTSAGLSVGTFTPDCTTPGLSGAAVIGKSFVKQGDIETVSFTVSEPLGTDPVVSAGAMAFSKDPAQSSGNSYVYRYTMGGGETEGTSAVTISFSDEAGNQSGGLSGGSFSVDFTRPVLAAGPAAGTTVARAGTLVEVTFQSSEDLDPAQAVTAKLGTIDMGTPVQAGRRYQFRYLAKETDGGGAKAVTVGTIADRAGNSAGPFSGPSVLFDFSGPTVTLTALDQGPHRSPTGSEADVVAHVRFTTSEPLDAALGETLVKVGNEPLMCPPGPATVFDCTYAVPRDLLPGDVLEGLQVVTVGVADAAGNAATQSVGTMTFDFTAPVLSMAIAPKDRPVKLGEQLTVSVAATEPLDSSGVELDNGGLALGTPTGNETNVSFAYTVQATDDATYTLTATAKDKAGNSATAVTKDVTLDGVVPGISNVKLWPTRVAGNGTFSLSFDVSEALKNDPVAWFGNGAEPDVAMIKIAPEAGYDYTYQGTGPAAGSVPFYGVKVSVTDLAENQGTYSPVTVEIDNVAPGLSGIEVAPLGAKLNDTVRVVLSATETLSGPPSITAHAGANVIAFAPVDSTPGRVSYSYTHVVTGGTAQGVYTVDAFTLTDEANNAQVITPSPAVVFSVDSSVPAVSNVAADKARYSRVVGYNVVSVTLNCSEDVGAGLAVRVGGEAMTCGAWQATSPSYTCTYTVQPSDTQGVKDVNVQAQDAAGNTGFGSSSVSYDFTIPAVLNAGPSAAQYKTGETVFYTVNVSEPLLGSPGRPALRVYKDSVLQPGYFGNPSAETDTSFTYSKAVTADGTYAVQIDLTDKAGNTVTNTGLPTGWTIDALPMTVTAVSVTTNNPNTTLAKLGNVVTAVFTTSENPPQNPGVTLGGAAMTYQSKSGTGPWTFTYTRTTIIGDTDGLKTATVTATDAAGNVTVQNIGSVTYDFTNPVISSSSGTPSPAGLGKVLTYTLNASEPLLGNPALNVTPALTLSGPLQSGTLYTWTRTIDGTETQGAYTVAANLTDLAGNGATGLTAAGFSIDRVTPSISTGPTLNKNPAFYKAGDTVTVTFTTNEDLDATLPIATLNTTTPVNMPCVAGGGTNDYTCSLGRNLTSGDVPQGQVSVSIALQDTAHNTGSGNATLTLDYTNPALVSATPSQAYYRGGQTIAYTVSVSEPLLGSPGRPTVRVYKDAVLQAGYFGAPSSETDTSFTYTKAVTADGTYTVQLDLTDKAGNAVTNTGTPAGWNVDMTAPVITTMLPDRGAYSRMSGYDRVTVRFDCSEDVGVGLLVKVGEATMNCDPYSATPPNYTCRYDIQGEPAGYYPIKVQAQDAAGNIGSDSVSVEFDFVEPWVTSSSGSPTPAGLGKTLVYTLNASEWLLTDPVLHPSPALSFSGPSKSATLYTWTRTIDGTETQGAYTMTVDMTDNVGNQRTGAPAAGFSIDRVPPSLATGPTLNKSPAYYKVGDTVTVTFTTNEDLDATLPRATLNTTIPVNLPCAAGGGTNDYTCSLGRNLTSGDVPQGQVTVSIALQDAAQNTGSGNATLTLDYTNPALVSATPSQAYYRGGQTIAYTVSVSEPLSGSPGRPTVRVYKDAVLQAGYFGAPSSETDTSFTYTKAVTADGTYTVQVDLTDKAGNAVTNTGSPAGWIIDATAPVVNQVSLTTNNPNFNNLAKNNDVVTAVFTANENPPSNPAVTIGGQSMNFISKTGSGPWTFTYTRTAASGDGGGVKGVGVTVTDAAGNVTVYNFAATVTYDFANPSVSSSGGTPSPVGLNKVLTYTLNASEPLLGNPALTVNPALTLSGPSQSGTLYTWTRTIDGTETQGAYTVTANLTDLAGNAATGLSAAGFTIDRIAPSIATGPTLNKSPAFYKVGDTVTVTLTTNEDLDATLPTATLNTTTPVNMACVAGGGTNDYTCSLGRNLTSGDVPQGQVSVSIALRDAAQNSGFGSATLSLDYTNPSLISATPSQAYYRGGQTIAYTVSVSEPLSGSPGRPTVRVYKDAVLQAGYFGNPSSETDTSFTYTKAVTADGVYTVQVDLTDKAGNAVTNNGSPTGWTIDVTQPSVTFTPPAVTTNNPNDNTLAKNGEVVTAVFNVNEAVQGTPTATIGGLAMSCSGSGPYTCTRTAATGDGSGVKTATVTATDLAGNVKVQDIGSVTFDFVNPGITANSASIALGPFGGCLLPTVTKVAMNTTARVSFSVTELLLNDPTVTINPSAGTWSITKYASAGLSYTYDIKPTGGSPTQGTTQVGVVLTDKAGNGSGTITLTPTFDVDTAAPAPITVAQNDKILYRRAPWGSNATAGVKKFSVKTLDAQTNAVEANSTVIFWDAASVATAGEAGRTTADGNGYFAEKEINRADRARLYLSQVDQAGNLDSATATELKSQEWTVTMGFKVRHSTVANPHLFIAAPDLWPSLGQDPARDLEPSASDLAKVTMVDANALSRTAEASWQELPTEAINAPKRAFFGLTYDSARGKVVIFGGEDDESWRQDTWEWDGASGTWTDRTTSGTKPSGRSHHAMTYDTARGKVVLFGGFNGSTPSQDTWELDGITGIWTDRTPAGTKPSVRSGHAMAYDSARGKVVLFGGNNGATLHQDTWEWDGVLGTWTDRTPAGTKPSARNGHAMAYDSARGRVVLFGGGVSQDTWEWDGTAGTWTDRTPGGTKPSGRNGHAMAYDPARGKVVMFGGHDSSDRQDTWEWDGTAGTWTDRTPAGTKPSARFGHAIAYDSRHGKVVLFGGYAGGPYLQDTWEWDGIAGAWAERTPAGTKPPGRFGHAMAFDAARGKAALFGGYDLSSYRQDTWEWDGAAGTWADRTPGGTKPAVRFRHAMAYDAARRKVVLFGGEDASTKKQDTWEWDGTAGTWTDRTPAGTKPSARRDTAMAYDSARGKVVVFGGWDGTTSKQDTWEWDGTAGTWTDRTPAGTKPPARSGHAMAYDTARGKVVLFGGDTRQDTWEWDGAAGTWTDRTPGGTKPVGRSNHSMAYDSARGKMMMFGGYDGTLLRQDTWEWDGAAGTWSDRTPGGLNPSGRLDHSVVYDSARGNIVLFGGYYTTARQDTWKWDGGASSRPGQVVEATFDATGLFITPNWQSVSIQVYAGASGRQKQFTKVAANRTWATANADCVAQGGQLATIASSEDQAAIESLGLGATTNYWIGASDQIVDGTFVWADLTPFGYTHWFSGEPNDAGAGCVAQYGSAGWYDRPCATAYNYICEVHTATDGVDLSVWDEGRWDVVATNTSGAGSPSLVAWTTADPAVMSRLFFGDQHTLNFAATPSAPNGTGLGQVAVDYAEVVVSYRLP